MCTFLPSLQSVIAAMCRGGDFTDSGEWRPLPGFEDPTRGFAENGTDVDCGENKIARPDHPAQRETREFRLIG